MPLASSLDFSEAQGPNASLPFGGATEMQNLNREVAQAGGQQGGPGGMMPSGGEPSRAGAGQPVQSPAPAEPPPPHFMSGGRVDPSKLSVPRGTPAQSWRERLAAWAAHPQAGPYLRAMARYLNENGADHGPQQ